MDLPQESTVPLPGISEPPNSSNSPPSTPSLLSCRSPHIAVGSSASSSGGATPRSEASMVANLDLQSREKVLATPQVLVFQTDQIHSSPAPVASIRGLDIIADPKHSSGKDGILTDPSITSTAPDPSWFDKGLMDDVFSLEADNPDDVCGDLSVSDIDEKYNRRLARARMTSYFAFVATISLGCVAIGLGISHGVVSLTSMGAQMCIDLLSSVLVIWRFYSRSGSRNRNPRHADPNYRLKEALREKSAALGVGCLLIFTAFWSASWAFVKVFGVPPPPDVRLDRARIALSVAWPSFVVFTCLASMKWYFALRLRSRVLQKDAVCGTFGAALAFVTGLFATIDYAVSDGISVEGSNTGAADSVSALIIASLLVVEGLRTIYQNSIGWIPPNGISKDVVDNYYQSRKLPAG